MIGDDHQFPASVLEDSEKGANPGVQDEIAGTGRVVSRLHEGAIAVQEERTLHATGSLRD
jgi:hypothetical protein